LLAFYLIGEVEKYGTGFIRARRIINEKYPNLKLELKERQGFFVASLIKISSVNSTTTPLTTPKTTPKTKILYLIEENKTISKEKIAIALGISVEGVRYHIKKLREEVGLIWVGHPRNGHWEVKNK